MLRGINFLDESLFETILARQNDLLAQSFAQSLAAAPGGFDPNSIKKVIFNPPATIVFFKDGTKSVVICDKDDTYNKMIGFCLCIIKRLCGNTSRYNNVLKKWVYCADEAEDSKKHECNTPDESVKEPAHKVEVPAEALTPESIVDNTPIPEYPQEVTNDLQNVKAEQPTPVAEQVPVASPLPEQPQTPWSNLAPSDTVES